MVVVGTVAQTKYAPRPDLLRVYRLDNKAIKDFKDSDIAGVVDRLGLVNYADLQIPSVRELYPMYSKSTHTRIVSGANACYVLGTFGDGGYICIRPHISNDFIRVIPRSRLITDVKKGNLYLLNAIIEQVGTSDTISPIEGEWEDMSYLKGRALVDAEDTDQNYTGRKGAEDNIGAGESVETHDELGMLNPEQKDFLKNYYIDYSVDTFTKLVGKTSWTLKQDHEIVEKNKKRRETKLARLAELRTLSGGASWRFAGLWDVGYQSNKDEHKCEFGHKLRYIYMACPVDKSLLQAQQDGTLLQFGIVCHADFLNIPEAEAKRLGKLLDTMCTEIGFISTVVANVQTDRHNELMSSMHSLLSRLQQHGNLQKVIGDRLANAYQGFVTHRLPLVESFVLDVVSELEKYGAINVLNEAGFDTSLFTTSSVEKYSLPKLVEVGGTVTNWQKRDYTRRVANAHISSINKINRAYDPYPIVLTSYAEMLIKNDIAGEYMYNPLATITDYTKGKSTTYQRFGADEIVPQVQGEWRKYLYGYNEDTRLLRRAWIEYFTRNTYVTTYLEAMDGVKVPCLTLEGLENYTKLAKRVAAAGEHLLEALGEDLIKKICKELSNVYYYSFKSDATTEFNDLNPLVLLATLPNTVEIAQDKMCRRAVYYALRGNAVHKLYEELDATKDGSDPAYLEKLRTRFTVATLPPAVKEKMKTLLDAALNLVIESSGAITKLTAEATADEVAECNKGVIDNLNECTEIVVELDDIVSKYKEVDEAKESYDKAYAYLMELKSDSRQLEAKIQVLRRAERQSQTTTPTRSSSNPYRGEVIEAQRLSKDFTDLYDSLPKVMTNDTNIQIAVDIIKRFRTKFKEKEGFTSREAWRVSNEIERLKRLKAQA